MKITLDSLHTLGICPRSRDLLYNFARIENTCWGSCLRACALRPSGPAALLGLKVWIAAWTSGVLIQPWWLAFGVDGGIHFVFVTYEMDQ